MRNFNFFIAVIFAMALSACDSKPKVIESVASEENQNTGQTQAQHNHPDEHEVVVKDILNTDKYTYMDVTEGSESFWVAIPKMEVEIGASYSFSHGLLKKNYYSTEFDRVFETVYLVSGVQKKGTSAVEEVLTQLKGGTDLTEAPANIEAAEGAIKISEIVANKSKYGDKLVKITGKCIKVNPQIMGKNWVHIQDGSMNDYDFTLTTDESIPLGAVVTLEGTITLDKDFGAGYRYEIIMEGAVLK